MTTIKKATFRLTKEVYGVLYGQSKKRQIVVGIEPGDILTFRESGRREKFSRPIDVVFAECVWMKAKGERVKIASAQGARKQLAKRGKL